MAKIWTVVFGLICFSVSAQQTDLFTGDFSGNTFADLVSKVEAQTTYRFYYLPNSLDSLTVDGHFATVPVQSLLQEVVKGTPFEFSVYKNSGSHPLFPGK